MDSSSRPGLVPTLKYNSSRTGRTNKTTSKAKLTAISTRHSVQVPGTIGSTGAQNPAPASTAGSSNFYPLSKHLKKILLTIKKCEQSIEMQRQRLASLHPFEPFSAF